MNAFCRFDARHQSLLGGAKFYMITSKGFIPENTTVRKHLIILTIGIFAGLWFAALGLLSWALGGAGHGTAFFGMCITSPINSLPSMPSFDDYRFYLALHAAFWMLLTILVAYSQKKACRYVALCMLIMHYLGIVIPLSITEGNLVGVSNVWGAAPGLIIFIIAGYACAQIAFWFVLIRKTRNSESKHLPHSGN